MAPISFAIQKPRPSAFDDSDSDPEAEQRKKANAVESLSEFDAATSSSKRRRAEAGAANGGPALVIPSQPNKDWKKEAQLLRAGSRRKVKTYLPDEALAGQARKGPQLTEAELAAADKITADAAGGLSQASRSGTATPTTELRGALAHASLASASNSAAASPAATQPEDPETDDARALRELLKGGGPDARDAPEVDVIEQHADNTFKMGSKEEGDESDNFRRDLDSRPDSVRSSTIFPYSNAHYILKQSTLDDYARVPVEHFGAALLRGMGWGSSATDRAARKPTEAIVPTARPALLGIGAKPLVSNEEPGSKSSSRSGPKKSRREEMKFVPLMKRETSGAVSRSSSIPKPC